MKINPNVKITDMISFQERDDIIHIMKMNRFVITDSDTAYLQFENRANNHDYKVRILVVENQPQAVIEKNGKKIFNEMIRSIDDLNIFLEEQLYKYLNDKIE